MSARNELFSDVRAIRYAAQLAAVSGAGGDANQLLTNGSPEVADAASMLRRGLAVISFASFERFLSNRIEELVADYNSASVRAHHEVPAKLLERTRSNAIEVVSRKTQRDIPQDEIDGLIASLGKTLLSTTEEIFHLSSTSLSWAGSNIGSEDLKSICEALGCKNPMGQLDAILKQVSNGQIAAGARELFRNFSERRHLSAHDSSHTVTILESRTLYQDVLYLGLAMDMLLTAAMARLSGKDRTVSDFTDFGMVASVHKIKKVPRGIRFKPANAMNKSTTYKSPEDYLSKVRPKGTSAGKCTLVLVLDANDTPEQILS